MAQIKDLNNVHRFATCKEWHKSFTGEEYEILTKALISGKASDVWPIVSQLDEKPFPFGRSALSSYMQRLRIG